MRMTLSHRYLRTKLDVLDTFGFPIADALNILELDRDALDLSLQRVGVDRFAALLDRAADRLGDPALGLRMGHRFRIATFAQTGSIYAYCKTLRDVIDLNSRYQRLAIDAGDIGYEYEDGRHLMYFRPYYSDHQAYRHITDLIMGAYGTAYRWLSWGSGEDLAGVLLPYGPPEQDRFHDRVFQTHVTFDSPCGRAALVFADAAMAAELTTHDPEKLSLAKAQLDRLLEDKTAVDSLDAAVEAAIRGAITSGRVTTQVVADRMGRDWPELRTALKATDRTFRARVDAVRQDMFAERHAAGESFASISQALAYNDQAAFTRAFKRWYGVSPGQWAADRTD